MTRVAQAVRSNTPDNALLSVSGLTVGFHTDSGPVTVIEDIDFRVGQGEIVGLVGESGCGKSVTAMSVMRLLPSPPGFVAGGRIELDGSDILGLAERDMRAVRGDRIGMIFQEPMTSLNPTYTVGYQVAEALRLHRPESAGQARTSALQMLSRVGISAPERRMAQYPHELSGGLRQRVMIAMALMCGPRLLIADEPTTALDVTIQAQILDLLRQLRDELGMAILMITHDLGVVAEFCERVMVMYAGRIVEATDVRTLFREPRHPYTRGLMAAMPRLGGRRQRLSTIPGTVPGLGDRPRGCAFADRCASVTERCRLEPPALTGQSGHRVACWNAPQ